MTSAAESGSEIFAQESDTECRSFEDTDVEAWPSPASAPGRHRAPSPARPPPCSGPPLQLHVLREAFTDPADQTRAPPAALQPRLLLHSIRYMYVEIS